ncbi:MAG: hypothetical protein ACYC0L_06550 [Thermoleophilia bacterium]
MEKTLLEILPLAIAATFSHGGLLFVSMITSGKDRPVKNSAVTSESHPGSFAGAIDILFGLLIIVVIGRPVFSEKKRKRLIYQGVTGIRAS